MSEWENLPAPQPDRRPAPVAASWAGFSADPRIPDNQHLRASDVDRDFATALIEQARAAGRLDPSEYSERAVQAVRSRTLGELAPLVSDLMLANAAQGAVQRTRNRFARAGITGWIGLAVLLNAIWLMTVMTTGHVLYYWPMWPMVGTGIPVLMTLLWGGSAEDARPRDAHREAHDQRRAARHARRAERHALRHGGTIALPPASAPPQLPPPDNDLR